MRTTSVLPMSLLVLGGTATNRALSDARAMERNAIATRPEAVPAVREAIGQLVAAQARRTSS